MRVCNVKFLSFGALAGTLVVLTCALPAAAVPPRLPARPIYYLGAYGAWTFQGLRVAYVDPGSPADVQAGLERGDVIVRINGQVVRNQSDFVNVINESRGFVRLLIRNVRDGRYVTAAVDLEVLPLPIDPPPPFIRGKHR